MRATYLFSPSFITRGRMGVSKAVLILMKNSHFDRTLQYVVFAALALTHLIYNPHDNGLGLFCFWADFARILSFNYKAFLKRLRRRTVLFWCEQAQSYLVTISRFKKEKKKNHTFWRLIMEVFVLPLVQSFWLFLLLLGVGWLLQCFTCHAPSLRMQQLLLLRWSSCSLLLKLMLHLESIHNDQERQIECAIRSGLVTNSFFSVFFYEPS